MPPRPAASTTDSQFSASMADTAAPSAADGDEEAAEGDDAGADGAPRTGGAAAPP